MKPVIVGGVSIPVKIATADEEPELEGRAAVYLPEEGYIAIDRDYAEHKRWLLLGHEVGHAVADHIGLEQLLKDEGLTETQASVVEELICNTFLAAYNDTLQRNGWLKPPRIR